MSSELSRSVAEAVDLVNRHAGQTCVWLRFANDPSEIDFVANAARVEGGAFEFRAGFETYGGSVEELAAIRVEVIGHS